MNYDDDETSWVGSGANMHYRRLERSLIEPKIGRGLDWPSKAWPVKASCRAASTMT